MKLKTDVLTVLSTLTVTDARVTMPQLDRALYLATDKALQALGGRWDRKAKAHVFAPGVDPAARIDAAIVAGEVTTDADLGFFPTPPALARELVARAGVRPGLSVLEPSAGEGAIARAARDAGGAVVCVEMETRRAGALIDAGFSRTVPDDFLRRGPHDTWGPFDRVVMNPPFGKRQDIAHVRHAAKFLRPGGRLVAVMCAGVAFRADALARDFRAWVGDYGGTIDPLPDDAFKPSGTNVRTVVVTL